MIVRCGCGCQVSHEVAYIIRGESFDAEHLGGLRLTVLEPLQEVVGRLHLPRERSGEDLDGAAGVGCLNSLDEQSNLESEALVTAFASVPREHYLGPGPWRVLRGTTPGQPYETTPDDDPRHLYQNALFAIDETRQLNNIGCGTGYVEALCEDGSAFDSGPRCRSGWSACARENACSCPSP